MNKAFVNGAYVIDKIPVKGGWSYVVLKEMKLNLFRLKKLLKLL